MITPHQQHVVLIVDDQPDNLSLLHDALDEAGYTVLVAFDCGNLAKVAKSAKEMFLGSKIVIGADNDQFTEGNPGVSKGRAAAALVFG